VGLAKVIHSNALDLTSYDMRALRAVHIHAFIPLCAFYSMYSTRRVFSLSLHFCSPACLLPRFHPHPSDNCIISIPITSFLFKKILPCPFARHARNPLFKSNDWDRISHMPACSLQLDHRATAWLSKLIYPLLLFLFSEPHESYITHNIDAYPTITVDLVNTAGLWAQKV